MNKLSQCAAGFVAVAVFSVTGCYASVDPQPVGYAEITSAPVDIDTYPSVMYEGQPVYFYGDHWWHRDGGGWAYYHDEPAALHAQREVILRSPRARVHAAPPPPVREEHH